MTAPLTGIQRARLNDLAERCDITGLETKAADLRQALALIDDLAERLKTAEEFLHGLIKHAGLKGYHDPEAGAVSAVLTLAFVRGDLDEEER